MIQVPRRALSGFALLMFLGSFLNGQDRAAAIGADIKKLEEKIKEESDRVAKKKENLQVEYAALNRPETKSALQTKLAEIGGKHRAAVNGGGAAKEGADSRAKIPASVKNAIQEDCKAALSATVGRNLATILDEPLAANLVVVLRDEGPINYESLLADTIGEVFTGTDFESNYKRLVPLFEKKKIELETEVAALKQRVADIEADARAQKLGLPPGMVAVPAGKYRIGMDAAEFEAARKVLRFGPTDVGGQLDKYVMGWPAHDVQLEEFFIDVNEVTNKYWAEFVKDTGRKPPKTWADPGKKVNAAAAGPPEAAAQNGQDAAAQSPVPHGMEDLPVTFVTYEDVELYCQWAGRRLPTEFEWEAATRFRAPGDKSVRFWPWGDTYELNKAQCNNSTANGSPLRHSILQLAPVGSFPQGKSALGINDLAGNAFEMTSSTFLAYPGWKEDKVPSAKEGKDPFSGSLMVLRGGSAAATEMYTLATSRRPMTKTAADQVGFRTAVSKTRGRDFVDLVAGGPVLAAQLEQVGPAFKDEKSGRAELAVQDPTRYTALQSGGWDPERQLPCRARYVAVICRNTFELNDAARIKSLARERKKPIMLGYFATDVELTKPAVPAGRYWVLWDPGRTKVQGKEKLAMPESFVFQSVSNRDNVYDIPSVSPVVVTNSTEPTKIGREKGDSLMSVLMSFPLKDRKEGRFLVELRLETAAGALKSYK